MDGKIMEQILAVRETGYTNMFDTNKVLEIAELFEFEELTKWLPGHKTEYANFILYGDDTQ